jgi:dihydrofolate reductase
LINIIVATDLNEVIGSSSGDMPWGRSMKSDLQRFRKLTTGHAVIMGRKTYETIGKPLPDRQNIILTRCPTFSAEGCEVAHSLDEAISMSNSEDVYVIGGAEIYNLALPFAIRIYKTVVAWKFEGNLKFPELNGKWTRSSFESHTSDERNAFPYRFEVWEREGWEREALSKRSYVEPGAARSDEQYNVLREIENSGKCPFCLENLYEHHTKPILYDGSHWVLTTSRWPYENTRVHGLLISKTHTERLVDLSIGAKHELGEIFALACEVLQIETGAVFLRFGDPAYNGGSVNHLHAHMITPDLTKEWESIKVKLGSRPKKIPPSP